MAAAMADMRRKAREASACGDFKLAADLYQQAIEAGPATAELHIARAWVLARSNQCIDAVKEADKGLELDPSIPRAYLIKGIMLIKMDDYQGAMTVLDLGYSYAPENSKFAFLLSICDKHVDEDFDESDDSEESETAREAFDRGDFKLALDLWTEYMDSSPVTPELYTTRALILNKLGRNTDAIEDLDTALKIDPSIPLAYFMKGKLLLNREDYLTAMAVLRVGQSYASENPKKVSVMLGECENKVDELTKKNFKLAESEETNEVSEAFEKGDFKLALDLCTQAINSGAANAELHTNRALILTKLGRNIDAIEELNTALKLDPNISKAYIIKGDVLMKMQDYHGAMAVFRLGCSYAPNNFTFDIFISKCEKYVDGSASGLCPSKPSYQHSFYNRQSKVVLSIYAKGISAESVTIDFSEDKLNVHIMAPDEEPYHFQCALFAEIIPEKSKYKVLAKEIEIRLAKKEDLTWLRLSKSSTMNSNFEFSWAKKTFNHKNIVPVVQDQGNKGTCVFHSITSTATMEMKRLAALRDPPESFKIKLSTNDFVSEFRKAGETIPRHNNALKVFKEKGVLIHGGKKYRIKGYQKIGRCFREIQRLLKLGRPIAGGFYADHTFQDLGPNDIYDYDSSNVLEHNDETAGHGVVFVDFGWREARAYLVFLNSYGVSFGDEGFGRVYLDHVRDLHTIDV